MSEDDRRPTDVVPDFERAREHVLDELVRFSRVLRRAGADVPANTTLTGARALVEVGFDRDRARAALRAALVTRQEDVDTFDRLFPEFWRRLLAGLEPTSTDVGSRSERVQDGPGGGLAPLDDALGDDDQPARIPEDEWNTDETETETLTETLSVAVQDTGPTADDPDPDPDTDALTASTYSPTGTPSRVSVDPAELVARDGLDAALRRLTRPVAALAGRRWTRGGGEHMDTRRALRESFGTGGTIVSVPRKTHKLTDVRCVLLVDVSQSVLDAVDRGFLVRFLRGVHARWRHCRIFFFDDRVQEVTSQFDAPTIEDALSALERAETSWGGGTRIGHAVETVRRDHPDAVDRNTALFVISDGLEVGEIDTLEAGMAWLSRRAACVLWLNPLAASPEYQPECRGMAAAIPYVDGLFAFGDAGDVAEMARQLHLQGTRGAIGYEHDPRRESA